MRKPSFSTRDETVALLNSDIQKLRPRAANPDFPARGRLRHAISFPSITKFFSNGAVSRTSAENAQLKKFGANVRRERTSLEMTQARLAELIDLNIRNVQKIEAGETDVLVTTLIRIRRALGCSADKLIPRE